MGSAVLSTIRPLCLRCSSLALRAAGASLLPGSTAMGAGSGGGVGQSSALPGPIVAGLGEARCPRDPSTVVVVTGTGDRGLFQAASAAPDVRRESCLAPSLPPADRLPGQGTEGPGACAFPFADSRPAAACGSGVADASAEPPDASRNPSSSPMPHAEQSGVHPAGVLVEHHGASTEVPAPISRGKGAKVVTVRRRALAPRNSGTSRPALARLPPCQPRAALRVCPEPRVCSTGPCLLRELTRRGRLLR